MALPGNHGALAWDPAAQDETSGPQGTHTALHSGKEMRVPGMWFLQRDYKDPGDNRGAGGTWGVKHKGDKRG